jgi:cation-transporting ATPase 13A3/4/5
MSESVPTSVTSFAHRHGRADSIASFTYLQPIDDDQPSQSSDGYQEALQDGEEGVFDEVSVDLEAGELSMRRISSTYSRASVHDRLLRTDSGISGRSYSAGRGKMSQKIYIVDEDLTIVVAGFVTSRIGYALYAILCTVTLGLSYLLFRWLPRWQVRLTGSPTPLRHCTWVVIEVEIDLVWKGF